MFLKHLIPVIRFVRPCERLFKPRFQAVGWWNVQCICFCFGRPHTAVPEQANRSYEKIDAPSFPLRYCWSFHYCWSESARYQVLSDNFEFCPSARLNSRAGFSELSMLYSPVQTCIARTLAFLSFVYQLFWLLSCDCTVPFGYSCASENCC